MSFVTNADIQKGSWGYVKVDKDDKPKFVPLGDAVTIESITTNIENNEITLLLSCKYLGKKKWTEIPREKITDYSLLQDLAKIGADVTRKHFDLFVDSLRLQEHSMNQSGVGTEMVYSNVGWKNITCTDCYTGLNSTELCFRADTIIGNYNARYTGNLKIDSMGGYDIWRKMVLNCVIGHTALEIVLLAGLSAVINGLIATQTTGENPIIHICGVSGSGKSTGAILAASTAGEPYDGSRIIIDSYRKVNTQNSVYGSWSATANAVLNTCSGNHGYPIILNELGKYLSKDMTSLIYNMSEGTDKKRLNQQMESYQLEGFFTTIISVGEHSILNRCASKADGLKIRVLEIDQQLTSSAEQADTIKSICRKNNGHAVPMMAQYIIKHGGNQMVLDLYKENRKTLLVNWPKTPFAERFVSKFPALFLTTADLAEKALNIKFSREAIIDYFLRHEQVNGQNRNSAATSYDMIIEECRIHYTNFHSENSLACSKEVWGAIKKVKRTLPNGKQVVSEYMIRPSIVTKILAEKGFENISTCIEAWEQAGVISRDKDRPTRSRKIGPKADRSEDVYVFYVFAGEEDSADKEEKNKPNTTKPRTLSPSLRMLLQDSDDDDEEKEKEKEKGDGNGSVA